MDTATVHGSTRILVVDDETNITDLLATALRYERFDVEGPHLIVLDVMLPDLDGFEVARKLADQRERVPVLFLTARDATEDRVRGLTLGGDDYVSKPFSLEELIARLRAILRRTKGSDDEAARLAFTDLEMDDDLHQVWRGGRSIELTATEYKLLRYLLVNAPRVLSKSQILDHVWNYDFGGEANIVETYISYLRKKVDRDAPPLIHTVRGVGYCLRTLGG
jgi:two-component system OmpR family response regulator